MAGGKDSTSSEYASAAIIRRFCGEEISESFAFVSGFSGLYQGEEGGREWST